MLARTRHHTQARRGIVLVLVLAMLGLLALIGVTFATFSGQARINARNYAQSVVQPQDDELMDFALQQLITDTSDPRSAIRGHSLARDMFGNDASYNGYLSYHLTYGTPIYVQGIQANAQSTMLYDLTTNIAANDSNFYGYNFTRWIIRVAYTGSLSGPTVTSPYQPPNAVPSLSGTPAYAPHTASLGANQPVYQTFEVISDGGYNSSSNAGRVLTVALLDPYPFKNTSITNQTTGTVATNLINWGYQLPPANGTTGVQGAAASQLPSYYLFNAINSKAGGSSLGTQFPCVLDSRWMHAFNGPGMGAYAYLGNFRYNGNLIPPGVNNANNTYLGIPGSPNNVGMDEDYDACDLENWFLAIQSADGQVAIPSFHRPGIIRYDLANGVNDWQRVNADGPPATPGGAATSLFSTSASRILRPCNADGHDFSTFGDLTPGPDGKITYDVDNDGDGATDSVWVDLGYPARRDQNGNLYKPLFAFMVIGLNGRIPLNTAGNLAAGTTSSPPSPSHAQHLGNSVSEIDPTYVLQNAFNPAFVGTASYPQTTTSPGGDLDPFNSLGTLAWPPSTKLGTGSSTYTTSNTQVDNSQDNAYAGYLAGGLDVRLIQLRNLLAGTRPQSNPLAPTLSTSNGDANAVLGSWGTGVGTPYYLPNGIVDGADNTYTITDPSTSTVLVERTGSPVAGRWGEAASIPGQPFNNPNPSTTSPTYLNLVQSNYANPVRAGYSFDVSDLLTNATYSNTPFPRDAADDNYNAFDVYPSMLVSANRLGEVGDIDFYDAAGALLLPIERVRRFVTPADINGTGRVAQFLASGTSGGQISRGPDLGADNYGRVQFSSYYRPPGAAGVIGTNYTYDSTLQAYGAFSGSLGAIFYPLPTPPLAPSPTAPAPSSHDPYYSSGPNPGNLDDSSAATKGYPYLADRTNNPFHGFEAYKIPNLFQNAGVAASYLNYNPQRMGGIPIDQNLLTTTAMGGSPPAGFSAPSVPVNLPTYDSAVNSQDRTDGVNEADEMNLYAPNPLLDSPFGPSDLEWLYRQQDVDGATITSRLAQLAPISFSNTIDGIRRRRLVALDSWESNNYIWTNDNPGGAFANNSRFAVGQNASYYQTGLNAGSVLQTSPTSTPLANPSLAHRDKKVNLNYPLPVSNDCNEPVRQKWISETYQLLKVILPPDSVDTAEELAQLSQFVINIIDFRDPDATMTHWINPDVTLTPGVVIAAGPPIQSSYPTLSINSSANGNLDQYGMEYNPVAINEVLAYSFQTRPNTNTATTQTNRFFIELVNTLTAAYNANYDYTTTTDPNNYYQNQASAVNLGGFNYIPPTGTLSDPYGGGCWDLVFTTDDPWSRPDPYRGELIYNPNAVAAGAINYYALIPLNRDSFSDSTGAPNSGDVTLLPVAPNPPGNANTPNTSPVNLPAAQTTPPTSYFYVIADPSPGTTYEMNSFSTTSTSNGTALSTTSGPAVTRTLAASYDPVPQSVPAPSGGPPPPAAASPTIVWRQGILPSVSTATQGATATLPPMPPQNFSWKIPSLPVTGTQPTAQYYWVCLRRPANPFAPVSATNPMCVVDTMRFPYIDGSGVWNSTADMNGYYYMSGSASNTVYSAQRLQPYRGGHAVPMPNMTTAGANSVGAIPSVAPPDARYGYSEQICSFSTAYNNSVANLPYGIASQNTSGGTTTSYPATNYLQFQTLGQPNTSAEIWDYFVFNDRDFTSVAELMLVPGCPPGLFTKQFAEFAPSQINAANIFANVTPIVTPTSNTSTVGNTTASKATTISYATSTPLPQGQFATTTVPFYSVSQATPNPTPVTSSTYTAPKTLAPVSNFTGLSATMATTGINPPVQPHSFPYLIDKFFYTGASTFYYPPTGGNTDPSAGDVTSGPTPQTYNVVGGPAADGWFKMFEFVEVPSQANGSIGPVASGANFDWLRQDTKPGLMNLNLIIDEEAFFGIFGRQNTSNNPYTQSLLNDIELPPWTSTPYALPLTSNTNTAKPAQPTAPIPYGWSPIPLVVTASQANGAPNYVYPISNTGYLATDPIQQAINIANYGLTATNVAQAPGVGNRMKAAFAQFLWLRHGGSGYLFGYGSGATGQNNAVATTSAGQLNVNPIPADRPFHSLSYPDINYTIMRPASLPPSTFSNPVTLADPNNKIATPVYNAAAMLYTYTAAGGATLPPYYILNPGFLNPITATATPTEPNFYAPFVSGNTYFNGLPIVYSGDPGVRNPFLNQGYASSDTNSSYTSPYPVTYKPPSTRSLTATANSVPAGVPLPVNVAFPGVGATPTTTLDSFVMPPPIPATRLFQVPDAYGAGSMTFYGYDGLTLLPPPVSNATDSGDPWINNQVPNSPVQTLPLGTVTPAANASGGTYALNNGFPSLVWPWMAGGYNFDKGGNPIMLGAGAEYNVKGQTTPPPPNPATGVLPLVQPPGAPANADANSTSTGSNSNLILANTTPYLGSGSFSITTSSGAVTALTPTTTDDRQHPFWRTEQLQRAMNLTTVRTHQYAVWITIGFFEVKRQGDIGMLAQGTPQLAFDIMGPEIGTLNGQNVRFRGFFLVDRLQLTGFNSGSVGAFHSAIIYRKVIQ